MKKDKYSPLTKEWWDDMVQRELLNEGGAYGHMAHPFDDKDLTLIGLFLNLPPMMTSPTFTSIVIDINLLSNLSLNFDHLIFQ